MGFSLHEKGEKAINPEVGEDREKREEEEVWKSSGAENGS